MKFDDPVIVYKWPWTNPKSGIINKIFEYNNKPAYRVYFYDEFGKYKDVCNIFTYQGDTIELDVITMRDRKIKELGI